MIGLPPARSPVRLREKKPNEFDNNYTKASWSHQRRNDINESEDVHSSIVVGRSVLPRWNAVGVNDMDAIK
ncbi:hypothetical protein SprV_0602163700 [Sparganum proliferum]